MKYDKGKKNIIKIKMAPWCIYKLAVYLNRLSMGLFVIFFVQIEYYGILAVTSCPHYTSDIYRGRLAPQQQTIYKNNKTKPKKKQKKSRTRPEPVDR